MMKTIREIYRKSIYFPIKVIELTLLIIFSYILSIVMRKKNTFTTTGIPAWLADTTKLKITVLLPSQPNHREPAHTVHYDPKDQFICDRGATEECAVLELPDGIATAKATNITAQGKLVWPFSQQTSINIPLKHHLFKLRSERFCLKIPHYQGTVISLNCDNQHNYFHWLFDVIPRISLYQQAGYKPQAIYTTTKLPFQKESLRMLGFSDSDIIESQDHPYISANTLIVPSFPCEGTLGHWMVDFIREKFLPFASKKTVPKKIYLSRSRATYRRISNEDEVSKTLHKRGFIDVYPEKLSFQQQIDFFANAEAVVAPHGAGLTNVIFSKPTTKVIQLFTPGFLCACYWDLCDKLGQQHSYLVGEGPTLSPTIAPYADIKIDINKLNKVLDLMEL